MEDQGDTIIWLHQNFQSHPVLCLANINSWNYKTISNQHEEWNEGLQWTHANLFSFLNLISITITFILLSVYLKNTLCSIIYSLNKQFSESCTQCNRQEREVKQVWKWQIGIVQKKLWQGHQALIRSERNDKVKVITMGLW